MSSDSEDDKPLAVRRTVLPAAPSNGAPGSSKPKPKPKAVLEPKQAARPSKPAPKRQRSEAVVDDDDDDDSSDSSDSSGSDDVPLSQRAKAKPVAKRKPATTSINSSRPAKRARASSSEPSKPAKGQKMWSTLQHAGVMFPPEYEPHGVKMLYDGKPVDLTPEEEEVASMFASMLHSDYKDKPTFMKNFWDGFKEVLGPKHIIKDITKCDFTPIHTYYEAEREKKKEKMKNATKEVRATPACMRACMHANNPMHTPIYSEEQYVHAQTRPPCRHAFARRACMHDASGRPSPTLHAVAPAQQEEAVRAQPDARPSCEAGVPLCVRPRRRRRR